MTEQEVLELLNKMFADFTHAKIAGPIECHFKRAEYPFEPSHTNIYVPIEGRDGRMLYHNETTSYLMDYPFAYQVILKMQNDISNYLDNPSKWPEYGMVTPL